jgi:glycosyltransferase involved in cell wall biosynthesis
MPLRMEATATAPVPATAGLRTLVLVSAGLSSPPERELRSQIAQGRRPDSIAAYDALGATLLDERYIEAVPGRRGRLLRRLPFSLAQVLEALLSRRSYDVVLTWGDQLPVLLAPFLALSRRRPAHVAILFWISKPKKAIPLRAVQRGIDTMVFPAERQLRFARDRLRLPAAKLTRVPWSVDTEFWQPRAGAGELICCVGREMRDYGTLIDAIAPLGIPCHIAAGTMRAVDNPWASRLEQDLPEGVTTGARSLSALRELYADSRFVVVPLLPSETDHGTTTILEAMAMGKAVICTDTPGQTGVVEHGVNGLLVPPGDAVALREAIAALWNDPERAERLGAAGRRRVEELHRVDQWAGSLRAVADGAVAERSARGRRP